MRAPVELLLPLLGCLLLACVQPQSDHKPLFVQEDGQSVASHSTGCGVHAPFTIHCKQDGGITLVNDNGTVSIRMVVSRFDPAMHRIEQEENYVRAIDGLETVGTDGSMPVNGVDSLIVMFGDCLIDIPRNQIVDMHDMSESCFDSEFRLDSIGPNSFELALNGGDGAGAFRAKFFFQDGKFQRRTVELRD